IHCSTNFSNFFLSFNTSEFCISCSRTIGPHRTRQLKSEFVQVTKKELALQERLPPRSKLNLTYGYLPGRQQSMPEDCWPSSTPTWPTPAPKKNDCERVLGYYKYTLVEYPGESSVRWGKLFWLMVIGTAVWFWFFR
ncbi:hypothetical protein QT971_24045, partial [Microcoleus sp. herbarium19]|uniref:hypothetical protein n=1 Tax=unclassified Microcoleus TaxID=2642155 RepID=UPI002FD1B57E